jgi:hypothetical protein
MMLLAAAAAGFLAGCQMTPAAAIVGCPLPSTEQVQEILAIAPLGTHRDEVVQRLSKAGIAGNYGENQSLFYCDLWKRSDDLRWHINVVLLFDDDGKLYATRPDAAGQVDPSPRSHPAAPATVDRSGGPTDPFLQ